MKNILKIYKNSKIIYLQIKYIHKSINSNLKKNKCKSVFIIEFCNLNLKNS